MCQLKINYSKSPAYEPSSCELSKMRVCVCTSSLVSLHVSGIYCHACPSPTSGCASVHCTVLYKHSSIVSLFQARSARGQLHWTPCCATWRFTNEDLKELEAQRKHKERQEEAVTEEPKSSMMQEIVKGFSLRGPVKFLRHRTWM